MALSSDCNQRICPLVGTDACICSGLHQSGSHHLTDFFKANVFGVRFLSHTLRIRVLNPAFLPIVLRTLRATLFPNNTLAPPRQPPSVEEAKQIKRRCAAALLELMPAKAAVTFFSSSNPLEQLHQVEELLDCLDDAYLNKHLIFGIVELIVLRLVPELGESGVQELMEDRLG